MVRFGELIVILELRQHGMSVSAIARRTGAPSCGKESGANPSQIRTETRLQVATSSCWSYKPPRTDARAADRRKKGADNQEAAGGGCSKTVSRPRKRLVVLHRRNV